MRVMRRMVALVVILSLFFAPIVFAELSDQEQKTLRRDAGKLAREHGVPENDVYRYLILLYTASKSETAGLSARNEIERRHMHLRALAYEAAADASFEATLALQKALQVMMELKIERDAGNKFVSPELSQRLHIVRSAAERAFSNAKKMDSTMAELTSFEGEKNCDTPRSGYFVRCSHELKNAVDEIRGTLALLRSTIGPFSAPPFIRGGKRST